MQTIEVMIVSLATHACLWNVLLIPLRISSMWYCIDKSAIANFDVSLLLSVWADELMGILKKLSLEKYQPIFEEQEVGCLNLDI